MIPLPIGATVRCRDGAAGRLKYVVLDPEDGEVTNLIVARGKLLSRDIVVPAGWVERATQQEIVLNASIADLDALPEYREFDFVQPAPGYRPLSGHRVEETRFWASPYGPMGDPALAGKPWILRRVRLGIQDDEVLLRRGLPVYDREGRTAGVLDHMLVEPGSHRVTQLVVRPGWLWNRETRIVPVEQVAALAENGVRLNISSDDLRQAPPYQPAASDAQVAASLQRSLETDPRTRDAGLQVDVREGIVRFIGQATEAVKETARAIARRVRGVIGLADELGPLPAPPMRIGAPVHARDGRYGTLTKVVVDPHVRRVTHLVVRHGGLLTQDRVIPIERVERVDADEIYLDASTAELDQYPRYREEVFVEPLPGWEAVGPYAAADTLFWGGPYFGVAPPIRPVIEHVVPLGVPEGELVLQRGANVNHADQSVGSLDHVLINPENGILTHLVVQAHEHGRRVIVPAEWIDTIEDDAIVLSRWVPEQTGVPALEMSQAGAGLSAA